MDFTAVREGATMTWMADIATAPSRRPRADAERNRQALLEAAVEVFAERGLDASVSEVAKRAGVGQGTAFRHYPTKERLVVACMGAVLDRISCIGVALLSEPDPLLALRRFMRAAAEMQSSNRGLIEAVCDGDVLEDEAVKADKARLLEVVGRLLGRAQDAGVVRGDIVPEDIPLLISAIGFSAAPMLNAAPGLWERYFDLVFDALRPDGASELTGPAPTRELLQSLAPVLPPRG